MENILRKIEELASRERTCSSQDLSVFLTLASGGLCMMACLRVQQGIFRMMSLTFSVHSLIYWVCDDAHLRARVCMFFVSLRTLFWIVFFFQ